MHLPIPMMLGVMVAACGPAVGTGAAVQPTGGSRIPVLYRGDASDHNRLDALTWTGAPAGSVELPAAAARPTLQASPDGSRLWYQDPHGSGAAILDGRGAIVATVPSIGMDRVLWADDNRHLCSIREIRPSSIAWWRPTASLDLVDPDGSLHDVAPAPKSDDRTEARLGACSVEADRAVVTRLVLGQIRETWVYTLSHGVLLYHARTGDYDLPEPVVATLDGRFFAGVSVRGTYVWTVPENRVIARFKPQPTGQPVGLSADGSRIVLWAGPHDTEVVDVRTGAIVWEPPVDSVQGPVRVVARPGSADLALVIEPDPALGQLWIVPAQGPAHLVGSYPSATLDPLG